MKSHFNHEFFTANRKRLKELFTGTAPIVLTANGLLQRGADSTYAFSQDANFWYYTGINEPDIILVMDKEKEYLIVPTRDASRTAFDGDISDDELTGISGVKTIHSDKDGWDMLGSRLKKVKHVATLAAAPSYIERYGMYTNPARARLIQTIKEHNDEIELLDLGMHVVRQRMLKQEPEVAAIQEAIDITAATIRASIQPAKRSGYEHEYELEAEISRGFRRRGASGHSFEPIVAGGVRACTLHNVANNGQFAASDLVVIDVGAEVEHYAADITRTVSLSGAPSRRQQAVHAAVLDVQAYAFSLLKPGVILKDYEHEVELYMGEKLRALGLIKIIDHDSVRTYYPHATSHFLGLNVHDVGDYERPLEPGNVLTVEPGIYITAEGIGIRIEDDVLITEDGIKILTDKLSRELA
jgi:Xaa-Pro aminopeptidase